MIEIKADEMEGGGQILRSSLSLSSVLHAPVKLFNIRAKRAKPGMQAQHLTGVQAASMMADAQTQGFAKGSTELAYSPSSIHGGDFRFNVGTAGSSMLVLQTILPLAAFAPSDVSIKIIGGTHVAWSPNFNYVKEVFFPLLKKTGFSPSSFGLERAGWYPKGGGSVTFSSKPVDYLQSINLESPGKLLKICGVSCCSNLPDIVAERQAESAKQILGENGYGDVEIEKQVLPSPSKGSALTLYAVCENSILSASSLGALGKKSEKVGEEAAKGLLAEMTSCAALDRHTGDQLLIYMALAKGESSVTVGELTPHIKTNIWVLEQFVDARFRVEELGNHARIAVKGIGLERSQLRSAEQAQRI
ncbi:RNA 3'-terminal phosphate cyclase [Candidatus Micrarchaeota archaeon]|nr:RNA 3'-terminal phosphate cyclase [Candidatus Micrarchaeota archaeon]